MKEKILILCFISLISGHTHSKSPVDTTLYSQNIFFENHFVTVDWENCYILNKNRIFKLTNSYGDKWSPLPDYTTSITKDPKNPNVLYRITEYKEVSKSMNKGESWIVIHNGLPDDLEYKRIIVNPCKSYELFLLTNKDIYKSRDAGFKWELNKQYENLQQFVIDIKSPDKYYLVSSDSLFLSNDAGLTWKNISKTLPMFLSKGSGRTAEYKQPMVYSIANIHLSDSSYVLAYTYKGIFKSSNEGNSWIEANNGITKTNLIYTTYINGNYIYIGGDETSGDTIKSIPVLYYSALDKIEWTEMKISDSGLKPINGIFKDNTHPGLYISTDDNRISYIDTKNNIIGLNYGFTTNSDIKAFGSTNRGGKTIYYAAIQNSEKIGFGDEGLWFSENEGISWKNIWFSDLHSSHNNIFINPYNPLEIWVFESYNNKRTIDGGDNWLENEQRFTKDIQFDPMNQNIMFISYGEGVANLLRYDKSTNNSTTILDDDIEKFVISLDDNNKIFSDNGKLSLDGGWSWNQVVDFKTLPNREYTSDNASIVPISIIGNQLTIAAYGNSNKLCFMSSDDNGKSWTWKSENIDRCVKLYSNQNNSSKIIRVDVYKSENSRDYEGLYIYQSIDNARTWKKVKTFTKEEIQLLFGKQKFENYEIRDFISTIYTNSIGGKDLIFLGLKSGGMIFSSNNGENWTTIGGIYESK